MHINKRHQVNTHCKRFQCGTPEKVWFGTLAMRSIRSGHLTGIVSDVKAGALQKTIVRRRARVFRIATSIVVPTVLLGSFMFAERFSNFDRKVSIQRSTPNRAVVAGVTALRDGRVRNPPSTLTNTTNLNGFDRSGRPGAPSTPRYGPPPPTLTDPASSLATPAASEVTPTTKLEQWRARTGRTFADGAILIRPSGIDVTPTRSRKLALRTGKQAAAKRFGKRIAPLEPTIEFGEFDAPTGDWIESGASGGFEQRSVWFIHYAGIESAADTPAITEFVVVIDDKTGVVLIASEYLA